MSSKDITVGPLSQVSKSVEIAVGSSQPLVYGVAASTILGLQINDWILIGTGVLLILNLTLSITRIISLLNKRKK